VADPDGAAPGGPGRPLPVRMVVGFGHFWWEFLVGDTPELFVGVVAVLGAVAWLCVDRSARTAAALILPVLVVSLLGWSVRRASHGRRR
jgi:hypothetical protein